MRKSYIYNARLGRMVELNRSTEPENSRYGKPLFGAPDPTSADVAVPRAFKALEQTKSARDIARKTGFSINHIKRIWGI